MYPETELGKILLVEDSPVQAMQTRLILEKAGYSVQVCPNGSMALAYIAEARPNLILLDLHLPDISGQEIARHIKSNPLLSGIPIIFLTGVFRQVQDIIRGLDQADDYIDKAVSEEELIARVRASFRARRTQRELGRLAQLLYTVSRVGSQFAGLLDPVTLPNSVVRYIHENFEYPQVALYLLQDERLHLAAIAGEDVREAPRQDQRIPLGENNCVTHPINQGKLTLASTTADETLAHPLFKQARSAAAVPLRSAGQIQGVLEITSSQPNTFSANDGLVLQTLADMAGMALHNARMYQHMEELANYDSLTGLTNRRVIMRRLEEEWNRARRYQRPISLVSLDLDHFKTVNDTYGHATGDRALQSTASLIKRIVRNVDLVGRMGGDEFLIVLPETDLRGARELGNRLCQECARLSFKYEEDIRIPLTISLGIATWPILKVSDLTEFVHASDQALYQSKAHGRNQVTVYTKE